MGPVAIVLGSTNLQNIKTLVFLETLEGKITCSRKIYKAMEASFQNVIKQAQQSIPRSKEKSEKFFICYIKKKLSCKSSLYINNSNNTNY